MLILGLNAYHGDSAACLVRDGQLVAAAEEERFRRIKHWAGLPTQAINYCLKEAGVRLAHVDHIAMNRQPGVNNFRRLGFLLTHRPNPRLVLARFRNIGQAATIQSALRLAYPHDVLRAQVHHVEHHLAHLASAFLVAPFDEAVCLSVDGFGDFASAAWGMGRGTDIRIDGRVYFPHSLGIFYSAITQFIGFPHFGDEYKVMGLAPYGEPKYLSQMRDIVRVQRDGSYRLNLRCFRHHTDNVSYTWKDCSPEVGTLYKAAELQELLGPARKTDEPLEQRHKDLARSAQAMYEEAFFALLNALHAKYACDNLALSGGCAMNSVANGKIYLRSPFRKMHIPAAAGDAGGAIGAALVVWHKSSTRTVQPSTNGNGPVPRAASMGAYCGPEFSDGEIESLLRSRGLVSSPPGPRRGLGETSNLTSALEGRTPRDPDQERSRPSTLNSQLTVSHFPEVAGLAQITAQAISEGKVIGWFQGRMEWGPRALGNRSILCDPRRADMKDILNSKIKRRESFRPFAPSILREHVSEWFEQNDDVPFMMQVFQIRAEKRALVPAVCHVDGSGRLQTVHRETNPRYHQLIAEFHRRTGVPMLLNTSFNENEPVVCRPEEALDCFLRTKMDVLVLGDWMVERVPEEKAKDAGSVKASDCGGLSPLSIPSPSAVQ